MFLLVRHQFVMMGETLNGSKTLIYIYIYLVIKIANTIIIIYYTTQYLTIPHSSH